MPADQERLMPGGGLPENLLTKFLCEKMNNLFLRVFICNYENQ